MNNMINYIKGHMTKIQVDSPAKKSKNISPYQQIYLQQIYNYIQAGGGYDVLREKLFRDINQNYMPDSSLVQQIVLYLRRGLETQQKQKQRRSINIIQQLVANCGKVMNVAFNQKSFCQVLAKTCVYLRKLKSSDRDQIRQHACGIFLYWHNKLKDEDFIYDRYYEKLRSQNAQFPSIPYIKQYNQLSKTQSKKNGSVDQLNILDINSMPLIIADCEQVASRTQKYLNQNNYTQINTDYVRMLKAKVKKIYGISTNQQIHNQLSKEQKDKLSQLYKKIRNQLKQIQKANEINLKQAAIDKQKQFLQQKMEVISPKKTQKQIPKLQVTPTKPIQKLPPAQLIDGQVQPQAILKTKTSNKSSHSIQQVCHDSDLLGMEIKPQQLKSPKNNQQYHNSQTESHGKFNKSASSKQNSLLDDIPEAQMSTPKKKRGNQYEQLLDLNSAEYDSQEKQTKKQIDFKKIYSASELSPQLNGIDLSGKKIKSKQSIKSDEQQDKQEFGQFK